LNEVEVENIYILMSLVIVTSSLEELLTVNKQLVMKCDTGVRAGSCKGDDELSGSIKGGGYLD
jgi:hypothetical protein